VLVLHALVCCHVDICTSAHIDFVAQKYFTSSHMVIAAAAAPPHHHHHHPQAKDDCWQRGLTTAGIMAAGSVPVGFFRAHAALKVCHGVCVACGMWRVYK
jgi:hypothetical protein